MSDGHAPGGGSPVSLRKVTLTKASPTVSLSKSGAPGGTLRVNLNWKARPPGGAGGWIKRMSSRGEAIDLDLGCLYEYTDGSRGVVQALGNAFTDRHGFDHGPILRLDGDDRTGTNSEGENLTIDLRHLAHVKRLLVFAFIYEGVANWAGADGVVTLYPVSGPTVEVRLDATDSRATMCAIALLTNESGELVVRREVRYVAGHRALDAAYGWGLRWTSGSK